MRNLASLTAMVLALLLGLAPVAQAGVVPCQHVVLECQRIPGGGVEVIMFSNAQGEVPNPDVEVGDDCSQALDEIVNGDEGFSFDSFFPVAITSGSSDKTVYTFNNCFF